MRQIFFGFLLLSAAGVVVEHQATIRQDAQLADQERELARLESDVRARRQQLAELQRQQADADRELTAHRTALASAEAGSVIKLWAHRITLLKRLLTELPARGTPEFRLLTPTDWAQVVRTHELDTADDIRGAFSALGALARKKIAPYLQEALRDYLKASAGKPPVEIGDLAPYLKPPADREMLERYAMVPPDTTGAPQKIFIRESAPGEFILSVGVESWDLGLNKQWENSPDEAFDTRFKQKMASLGAAVDLDGASGDISTMLPLPAMFELLQRAMPQVEALYGDGDKFGKALKVAVQRYAAAKPGHSPTDLAQLAPYLDHVEKLSELARPLFAELKYIIDHNGQSPTEPSQLERYLKAPFDPREVLRMVKIKAEDRSVTVNIEFSANTTTTVKTETPLDLK